MDSPKAELFKMMAESVRDYAIFLLDTEGCVISWNAGARLIKQYAADEILGKHFSIFYAQEDINRRWPEHELAVAKREGRFEDEGWRVKKDGTRFWASVIITALRDEAGHLVAFSKITRDLTERKTEQERLRESEERFRLLVEGVQDYAIYMLSPEGLVSSWNSGARRIKGYDDHEVIGKHFSRFYASDDIDAGKPWAHLAIAREHGRAEDEGWLVRKDGARFWARTVLTALYDSDSRLRGFTQVTQDLSQRRRSESLELAARQLTDFVAVLAHELRNPLAPIRNAVHLMGQIPPDDPDYEPMRQTIDRQSRQLSRIVDDLLDISRVTRGTFSISARRTTLSDLVARAVEAAKPLIEREGHRLELHLPSGPLEVLGDEVRLTQALTNLLNNAARYSDPGGHIALRLSRVAEDGHAFAEISVKDRGRGIDPDLLGSIFGMFVQGRDPEGRADAGLGVGLALARTIVELHHGTLEARSEGRGKGAEFVIRIPLVPAAAAAQGPPASKRTAAKEPAHRRRILVVDDNVDAAAMLGAMLKEQGHEVHTVHGGEEALHAAEGFRPDIILLDIGMPEMSGYEVARRLRERNRSPRPLIVAVTGWGKPEDRKRALEAGFDVHLTKPVEGSDLERVLSQGPTIH